MYILLYKSGDLIPCLVDVFSLINIKLRGVDSKVSPDLGVRVQVEFV